MHLLGLTGSIGMGKSTTAGMFRAAGVPVFDSDAAVHSLYQAEAVPLIADAFPGTVINGAVDRARLSKVVLGDQAEMKRLEAIVHPLVRQRERAFRAECQLSGYRRIVLDIPLLFETGGADRMSLIVVVSASEIVQKARVLARPGMTEGKLAAILAKQMPDSEKRRRAHVVVDTGSGFEVTRHAVEDLIRALASTG